jgi:hypothetical protein
LDGDLANLAIDTLRIERIAATKKEQDYNYLFFISILV